MTDILIIGGGIAGLSAGAKLAPFAAVTVLEAEDALGYHASGRSAALFEINYGPPSVLALNRASAKAHEPYLSPRGFLLLGREGDAEQFAQDMEKMELHSITLDQAVDLVPILDRNALTHAAYHDAAKDIDTDLLMQDFARVIRQHGGQVITGHRVTAIRKDTAGWAVTTKDQTLHAETLVNAAGAWADKIATLAGVNPIGILPRRRSMARLAPPGGHNTRNWPMFFGTGETWYAKPDAGSLLVSPADAEIVVPQDAYADDMVLAEGLARYQDVVTEDVTRPQATWAGLRSFAPDGTLVLGPATDHAGFVWCAGQGGYGFQTAHAASDLLRDLVLGRPAEIDPHIVDLLTPQRFDQ